LLIRAVACAVVLLLLRFVQINDDKNEHEADDDDDEYAIDSSNSDMTAMCTSRAS